MCKFLKLLLVFLLFPIILFLCIFGILLFILILPFYGIGKICCSPGCCCVRFGDGFVCKIINLPCRCCSWACEDE